MATKSEALAAKIATRHGIVTRDQLLADGHSRSSIRWQLDHGALVQVHKGVFRLTTSPDTFEARCAAVCLADPAAIITGVAAGRLWGFRHTWQPDVPHVLVSHGVTSITRGVVLRRSNVIDANDRVERSDGIIVASPPRTWFDCARDIDDAHFERLTEWVLDRHSSLPTLWRTARRLQAKGRPGSARVKRVMSKRDDWQKPADSGLELRVLQALEARGIVLVRQFPLTLGTGVVVHLDGADPAIKWALEVDHVTWHGGRFETQRDKTRDREARLLEWQIERVTDQELAESFDATIDQLARLYHQRRASVRAA